MTSLPDAVVRRLTGRVPLDRIETVTVRRHPAGLTDALLAIPDMTCGVADALDAEGIGAVVSTRSLDRLASGMRVCGPAITLRYIPVNGDPSVNRTAGDGLIIGDRDLYALAEPGDVAVIDCSGMKDWAVLGGMSALWAVKAGVVGAVVDGAVRDTTTVAASGLHVWSASRSPRAGRYRIEAAALNVQVSIASSSVNPGDYVVADDDGICIVPHRAFPRIVERCTDADVAEQSLVRAIADSTDVEDLVRRTRGGRTPG